MSFPNNSLPVTNSIGLTAETDTYPTHLSNLGLGGLHSVLTRADRNAITLERRVFGMEVNVTSEVGFIGKYKLSNLAMGGVDNDLKNNNNWKIETIQSTGDYYVHFTTGKDLTGAGSVINPFKTIQYALANVPNNKRIKILQDDYFFTGVEKLHYQGTIELQGAIIHVNLNAGEYLINNFGGGVDIIGEGTIQIEGVANQFLRHRNTSLCKVEGIKVLFNSTTPGPIDIQNARFVQFKDCVLGLYPNNQSNNIQLFNSEQLGGADFLFVGCQFNGIKIKFWNYSSNGGATFKECSFYGTYSFGNQDNYLEIGKSFDNQRILLIEDTVFDMVSLGSNPSNGIILYQDDTEITLRGVDFLRYTGTDRNSIFTDKNNCKIFVFNCTTRTPVADVGTLNNLTILPAGEFKYFDNLPAWVR